MSSLSKSADSIYWDGKDREEQGWRGWWSDILFLFFSIYIYFYLAVLDLSCGTQDLWSLLQLAAQTRIEPRPPYWEYRVLATGLPGKSLKHPFSATACGTTLSLSIIEQRQRLLGFRDKALVPILSHYSPFENGLEWSILVHCWTP